MTNHQVQDDDIMGHHFKMVGILTNNAALCDAVLFSAFKLILGCDGKIANAIYFSSESLNAKINLVNRMLKAINDPKDSKIIKRIISATEKAHNQRSELSHALLKVKGEKLISHNPRRQVQPQKRITAKALDSLHLNSSRACVQGIQAYEELCQKHGQQPVLSLE